MCFCTDWLGSTGIKWYGLSVVQCFELSARDETSFWGVGGGEGGEEEGPFMKKKVSLCSRLSVVAKERFKFSPDFVHVVIATLSVMVVLA